MTEEIPIQRLIEPNARYMLEQMRAADPSDAVRYSAAVKNLAGSLAELSGGGDTPSGLRSIIEKLYALPDDTRVWPGHDYGPTPWTTIARERESNPFTR